MSPPGAQYSFDTSALIDGIERFYPIDNFPALWDRIDELIEAGRLHVSEEAWKEAVSVDSALKDWCPDASAGSERCVVPTDAAIATVAGAAPSSLDGLDKARRTMRTRSSSRWQRSCRARSPPARRMGDRVSPRFPVCAASARRIMGGSLTRWSESIGPSDGGSHLAVGSYPGVPTQSG